MKKVLIASTALVAATMVSAGAASASEKIKLNLGGFSKWWVVGAWNESSYNRDANVQPTAVDVKGDNEVYFGGSTTLDNGLKVGIDIQLEAGGEKDTRAATTTSTDVIDESYVWLEGGFGKLIVGSKNNGTYLIHNTAPDAAGNWNEGGILTGGKAVAIPTQALGTAGNVDLPGQIATDVSGVTNFNTAGAGLTTAILTDGDSEGVTYVSPTFYGFTFGASYKANGLTEDNRGVETAAMPVYGAGVLYANTFGGVGLKADFGYAQYDASHARNAFKGANDVAVAGHGVQREISTGANVSYAGFTLGGSYRQTFDNKNSEMFANNATYTKSYDSKTWDAGLQYASGPYAVSFAYINSKSDGLVSDPDSDKVEVYQVSGKYTLGAGVDVLASAGYLKATDEAKNNNPANPGAYENKGWTVMTGLSLAF